MHEPDATLTLNLFDDVTVTGLVEQTAPTFSGGYSISGPLIGTPLGNMTLVVNDNRVVGRVLTPDGTYHIRSVGDGRYTVSQVKLPLVRCTADEPHPVANHPH